MIITRPKCNQLSKIILKNDIDIHFGGYLKLFDTNKLTDIIPSTQYIYRLTLDVSNNNITYNSYIYIDGATMYNCNILIVSDQLYITTDSILPPNQELNVVISDTNASDNNAGESCHIINYELLISTFIQYTLYKKNDLGDYNIFINSNNNADITFDLVFNTDYNLLFNMCEQYATFEIIKSYDSMTMERNPDLIYNPLPETTITTEIITEKATLRKDLALYIINNVRFYINDMLIEELNPDITNIMYQFFCDTSKRTQLEKMMSIYMYDNNYRVIVPLQFWFRTSSVNYLPLISLNNSDITIRFSINDINNLITNENYTLTNIPTISIQMCIDGILLDSVERKLFATNIHEYLIERFKSYSDNIINKTNCVTRLQFKNLIKDMFFITNITNSTDLVYYNTTKKQDHRTAYYEKILSMYSDFINNNIYAIEYLNDLQKLKDIQSEILLNKSDRIDKYSKSLLLKQYDMQFVLFLDLPSSSYEYTRQLSLERFFAYIYMNKVERIPVSPIDTMNLKAGGIDLFNPMNSKYFSTVVPFQRYENSVAPGYYGYSFALYPLELQPSGHLNFSVLDDITLNTTNNSMVLEKPFILKTIVREYQILRIMSGLGAITFNDN
jgi:hypothetical protein